MPSSTLRSLIFGLFISLSSSFAIADVLVKADKHPDGRLQSTNFTVYNDTIMVWTINGREGSLFFPAGTQVAMPWNSTYRFAQNTVISYDQRKLYEISAGTSLTTPDYVADLEPSVPPQEDADDVHCVKYKDGSKETHCLVVTDKEDEGHSSSKGAYTSVNVSVKGNGQASGSAKVEGCKAIASSSAVVIGSGSASSSAVASAWGCK